ncbi:MAG TPA: hypothetical protein VEU55_02755 [Gemmatimonadales bacterium]|nr:hypothetical protein [Gemmatimonadales bacterium]
MKLFLRHLLVCSLPLLGGVGAGYGFALKQGSCGALVGVIFTAKCHGVQREWQMRFQLAGAGVGTVVAAGLGTWLEQRRRRVVQPTTPTGDPS